MPDVRLYQMSDARFSPTGESQKSAASSGFSFVFPYREMSGFQHFAELSTPAEFPFVFPKANPQILQKEKEKWPPAEFSFVFH